MRLTHLTKRFKLLTEPGAIPIFRLFTNGMQILFTLGFCAQMGESRPDFFVILYFFFNTLLFIYLWFDGFATLMGKAYLTIGLILATIGPILAEGLSPYLVRLSGVPVSEITPNSERLILWLIVPFLVVATQYNLWQTFLYSITTALLPILIALPARSYTSYFQQQIEQAGLRLFLFILIGYIIVRLTQGERQQRQALLSKNEELAQYAATLEELAVTRERNRLARELHDTLAHTLSAVNIQLKALEALWESDPAAARERLSQMQALTRDGLNDARRSLKELRARPIEEMGLPLALRRLIQQASERGGFRYQVGIPLTLEGIPSVVEQQIYRITEEGLNNIVRHAQAKRVELILEKSGRSLLLKLIDDGVGFDQTEQERDEGPNGRFGLMGMQERAELVQGSFKVNSQSQQGTEIEVKVPL